jgi:hypothetical protein
MFFYRSRADERSCGLEGKASAELEEERGLKRTKKDFS